MWPLLLDMTKVECKKALRTLELEAYSILVSALRAQGDLTNEKLELLKQLQKIFRISLDRHKAELRRATNDERLFTIAKRLSCGNCVSKEWIKESKRQIPLLGNYQFHASQSMNASKCQKLAAEQVLGRNNLNQRHDSQTNMDCEYSSTGREESSSSSSSSVNSNSHDLSDCEDDSIQHDPLSDNNLQLSKQNRNLVNIKNGYTHDSTVLNVETIKPNEYLKKFETISEGEEKVSLFMKTLIKKFKQHQEEQERTKAKAVTDHQMDHVPTKTNKNETIVTSRTNNNRLLFNGDLLALISKNKQAIENSLDDPKHATSLVVTNGQLKTNATLCSVGTSPTAPLSISALQSTTLTKLATTPTSQMVKFPSTPTPTATLISTSIEPTILNPTTNTTNHFSTTPIRLTTTDSTGVLNRAQFTGQKVIYLPTSSNTIQTQLKSTNDANNLVQKYVFYKKPSLPVMQPSPVATDSNENNANKNFKLNLNQHQFVNLPQTTSKILLNVSTAGNLSHKPQLPLKLLDNSYVVDAQVKCTSAQVNGKNSQELLVTTNDSDVRSNHQSKLTSAQGYENGKILLNDITLNNTNPIAFVRLDQVAHAASNSATDMLEMSKNKKIKLLDMNSTD